MKRIHLHCSQSDPAGQHIVEDTVA